MNQARKESLYGMANPVKSLWLFEVTGLRSYCFFAKRQDVPIKLNSLLYTYVYTHKSGASKMPQQVKANCHKA